MPDRIDELVADAATTQHDVCVAVLPQHEKRRIGRKEATDD